MGYNQSYGIWVSPQPMDGPHRIWRMQRVDGPKKLSYHIIFHERYQQLYLLLGGFKHEFYFPQLYLIGSMYGIYANIWGVLMVNVTIYTIHGSYGYGMSSFPLTNSYFSEGFIG